MKKILASLFMGLSCCSLSLSQTFEGTFTMHVQDDNSVSFMNFFVHKDKMIMQPVDPSIPRPVKFLLSKNSDEMYVLTEEQGMKLAIRTTFKAPAAEPDKTKNITAKETGQTKKIEGMLCKEVLVDDGAGQQLQLWVTSELGITMAEFYEYLGKFSAGFNNGSYEDITKFNGVEIYQKNMALELKEVKEKDATVIWIKNIVRTPLPDSDFSTEGYMVVDAKDLEGVGGE